MNISFGKNLKSLSWLLHAAGLLLTLGSLAFPVLVLHSHDRDYERLERKVSSLSTFLRTGGEIHADNRELNRELASVESRLADLMARIPDARDESVFLAQIAELAAQHQLVIRNYRPGIVHEKEKHREMEISVSANGDYQSWCRFLDGLESLPRLCRVTNLNISAPDESTTYPIEMTLRIYFAPKSASDVTPRTTSREKRESHV